MEYTEATRIADEERRVEARESRKHNYPDTKPLPDPVFEPFDVVFKGEGPHLEFVEVEKTFGHEPISVGTMWVDHENYRRLTIRPGDQTGEELWKLADKRIPFSLYFEPQTDPYENPWTIEIGSVAFGGMTPSETAGFTRGGLAGVPSSDLGRMPKRFSIVITERPGETWLFNLGKYNSEDDIAIPEEVGRAILAQMARDEEE